MIQYKNTEKVNNYKIYIIEIVKKVTIKWLIIKFIIIIIIIIWIKYDLNKPNKLKISRR